MPVLFLETYIKASVNVVFDLSRSIDLHKSSMMHHREEVVDGIRSGLMKKGDTVTWQARHLFKLRKLKVMMTDFVEPAFFADEMLQGDFKRMRHEHYFKPCNDGTTMTDRFQFETPFGILGTLVNAIFLKQYMKRLLQERNKEIKQIAESNLWKQYLTNE